VRIKGALISDDPHWTGEWTDPKVAWGNHYRPGGDLNFKNDKLNPVRWTEIHPPDLVEVLDDDKPPLETVRCVALFAYNGLLTRETRALDFDIYGPEPKPSDSAFVTCVENVNGANTNFQTILEGNNGNNFNNTGAQITAFNDHVHIHVTVKGELLGVAGKFNAIYRVFWAPHQLRLRIEPSPETIIAGSQTSVNVYAEEVGSQLPVSGRFTLDDEPHQYDTGPVGVTHIFKAGPHFVRVTARDYPDARLSYSVSFRLFDVSLSQFPVELDIPIDLTISVKDKADSRPIYGATVKIINPGKKPTDPTQRDTYTTDSNGQVVLTRFIFRAKTHPRGVPENPFGKVSTDNYHDKEFNLVETDLVEPETDLGEPVPPE